MSTHPSVIVGILSLGLLAVCLVTPAAAQDEDLDPLLLREVDPGATDVGARSFQVYRIPLSYKLRSHEEKPWGFRITFPVSFGVHELDATTDVEDLFARLETASIIPGIEFQVPLGERWLVKPFAEVGIGTATSGGDTEVLYGLGVRARGRYRARPFHLTLGGAFKHKNTGKSRPEIDRYNTLEAGVDAQLPLGFSIGNRKAMGGAFGFVRSFSQLEIPRFSPDAIEIDRQYEVGLSFSTDPGIKIWKIKLPWLAVGYRFGDIFTGWRLYFSFPF
jgi:hypothetical protein